MVVRANEEEAAAVADGAPAILARAAREGRTLLTRDRKLAVSRWRNQVRGAGRRFGEKVATDKALMMGRRVDAGGYGWV